MNSKFDSWHNKACVKLLKPSQLGPEQGFTVNFLIHYCTPSPSQSWQANSLFSGFFLVCFVLMEESLKIAILFKNLTGEWQPSQAKGKTFTFLKSLKCNPCQYYCDVFMMLPKLNTLALYVREGLYVWGKALPSCWNVWTSVTLTPFLEKTHFFLHLFWCIFGRSVAHTKTLTHCEMWVRLGFQQ